ncbi:MAG: hypothetical protein RIE56_12245, partial [Amphiplicatus sp.]
MSLFHGITRRPAARIRTAVLAALIGLAFIPALPADGRGQGVRQPTGLPLPRYVSLRAAEVNLRTGPGVQYPIEWLYKRQHLPVEIIA